MAKTKTPFLSLGAQGSVGGSITAQKRGNAALLRRKPSPTDPYSLPQAYQRWLYQDYAHLWTKQDEATKRQYATAGSRFHRTGFQQWMKVMLTTLPDLIAWWHLDEKAGDSAIDFSRNGNHLDILGPTPAPGLIDGAFSFDGENDYLTSEHTPTLDPYLEDFSILLFLQLNILTTKQWLLHKVSFSRGVLLEYAGDQGTGTFQFYFGDGVTTAGGYYTLPMTTAWHLVAFTVEKSAKTIRAYIDTQPPLVDVYAPDVGSVFAAVPAYIGGSYWVDGRLDNYIYYRRLLSDFEVARWAARRYPV